MLLYIAFLDIQKLKGGSVVVYLSALRSLHIEEGYCYDFNNSARVKRALKALDNKGPPPDQKLPITFDILKQMHKVIPRDFDACVLWAAMTLAFFGCMRAAEVAITSQRFNPQKQLCLGDAKYVSISSGELLTVRVKYSKTDDRNIGFTITLGCSKSNVCSHCSLRGMISTRRDLGYSMVPDSPLFLLSSGMPLTKQIFVSTTRKYLKVLNLDPARYSGHSFRAGCATTAATVGLADYEIQLLGRWTSSAYQRYVHAPASLLAGFSSRLDSPPVAPNQAATTPLLPFIILVFC